MKKFVFAAFFAVCSIGFAASSSSTVTTFSAEGIVTERFEKEVILTDAIVSIEFQRNDNQSAENNSLFFSDCEWRVCEWVNGRRVRCSEWMDCDTFVGGTLDPVVITAPKPKA